MRRGCWRFFRSQSWPQRLCRQPPRRPPRSEVSRRTRGMWVRPTGRHLVVGHNYEVDNLNPLAPSNNGEILVQAEIYAGLTRPAPSGAAKIAPGLVDRWKEAKNRKSWTLHIRRTANSPTGSPSRPPT